MNPSGTPSSAGECWACERHAEKRYGGMGRYHAVCLDCWNGPKCSDCGDPLGYDIDPERFTRCGDCLAKCFRPLNIA
jgi:hypothetical protein